MFRKERGERVDDEYLKYVSELHPSDLRTLMERHGEDVWNYAYFLTKKRDLADDIAQDVFVKAFRGVASFRGECCVKTWLLKITRNTAYSYRRKAFFRRVILADYVRGESPSAESEFLERHLADEAWKIVLELPAHYREVLVLQSMHGMSVTEIAAALEISEGTVKSRIHRARRKAAQLAKGGFRYEENGN
ncbi:RNA polymerase sigma factor [Paenibacillus chitinolyticus]|uniref:RNA polymerase sigma factor n=1 Tax=Paenibacillus chitinolyticus TaxID=79263 RepID=UPI002DBE7916|nr:RNA polymerase sigma factor [Paenibacillus chitinolyticus]MEC0244577.1 RNA polymerase sigma factor [Paenibacillus chitinolyticus]